MKDSLEKSSQPGPGKAAEHARTPDKYHQRQKPIPFVHAIKRILVPVDFTPSACKTIDLAIALAEPLKATLILLHIVEPQGFPEKFLSTGGTMDETTRQQLDQARERLAALYHRKQARHVSADSLVRMGRAYSEICDTAKALAADLIVIGLHNAQHTSLGSTAERVLRHAGCPVLTVPLDQG